MAGFELSRELLAAVNANKLEAVRGIIQKHPSIDLNQFNCIHWAVTFGRKEMTKLLINSGADVNARGMAGKDTPLMIALSHRHVDIVQLLLTAEADVKYVHRLHFAFN